MKDELMKINGQVLLCDKTKLEVLRLVSMLETLIARLFECVNVTVPAVLPIFGTECPPQGTDTIPKKT